MISSCRGQGVQVLGRLAAASDVRHVINTTKSRYPTIHCAGGYHFTSTSGICRIGNGEP